ncbi:hypothetical protein CPU12_05690 [Malaciobacter molluscorum LMG 25693]|uniref:Molybdopterin-containing oxidoreductase III, DMSO/TMAO/BSO reductase family, monoheme c-type cytochrome n=1 Tax=Malaciobacter molluscorum LMG 25693 TaxID=870501 RepID=A0A2G1DJA5_9BACT|nr:hypothetical protein [Malaciobacter molluscorum]AXX93231.1 molybdopterin-containing oxidoreductase III, DMSO/TMAO/BSO reductase family, monoheme c-type cytochrome [Malaciobacter molluscorum LMG 25693]PHO18484.1 hypothetical protein CPU12_05690 [Malaciobacter molluscorum LMG 25693]
MRRLKKGLLLLSLLSLTSFTYAQDSIINERTKILQNGKDLGFITVLTPIDVVKKQANTATIKIKGYRLENYPQMIVRDLKRKELYVEFKDEESSNKYFKTIKEHEDDYGEIWHEVEGVFTIDIKNIAKNPDKLKLKAKKTYEQNCSMCHHLPASNAYTVNQWPQQIESMMEQVTLEPKTKNLIIKYLQQHAADAK